MEMTAQVRIEVPAARAWEVVGTRFGDIAAWVAPITASSLDRAVAAAGAIRTCQVSGLGPLGDMVVRERLLAFDDAGRSLMYDAVDGMPRFVRRATNRWTVEPDGASACVVRTRAVLDLVWWMRPAAPFMAARLRREGVAVLDELAHHLRTGRPHPRKAVSSAAARTATGTATGTAGPPTVER